MSTVSHRPPGGPGNPCAPRPGTCRLTLAVDGTPYAVRPSRTRVFAAFKAFRMAEPGGASYVVASTPCGFTCSCGGAVESEGECVHARALLAAGLLDPLQPHPALARYAPEPAASLAALVDREADAYRSWGTPEGELLARTLDELALKVRMTDATTPQEYEGRIEVLDAEIRRRWEAIGFEAGKAASDCCCGLCRD